MERQVELFRARHNSVGSFRRIFRSVVVRDTNFSYNVAYYLIIIGISSFMIMKFLGKVVKKYQAIMREKDGKDEDY